MNSSSSSLHESIGSESMGYDSINALPESSSRTYDERTRSSSSESTASEYSNPDHSAVRTTQPSVSNGEKAQSRASATEPLNGQAQPSAQSTPRQTSTAAPTAQAQASLPCSAELVTGVYLLNVQVRNSGALLRRQKKWHSVLDMT